MSDVGMIMALVIAHMYLYFSANSRVWYRRDGIATGVIQGVAAAPKYRRSMLEFDWFAASGAVIVFNLLFSIGYALIGQYAAVEGAKMFAYLCAFLSFITALGWILTTAVDYVRLRSVLRQAEAD